jgi:hypothetical protein
MDDLLALLAALFDAWSKRDRPAARLGKALREAFAERVPARGTPAAPVGSKAGPGAPPSATPVAAAPPATSAAPQLPNAAVRSAIPSSAGAQPPEAGQVTALFANPQSLVAAFIVAEVLAKPIALRDPRSER